MQRELVVSEKAQSATLSSSHIPAAVKSPAQVRLALLAMVAGFTLPQGQLTVTMLPMLDSTHTIVPSDTMVASARQPSTGK